MNMNTITNQGRETRNENMSSTLIKELPAAGPSAEELKLGRRHSRKAGIFDPELLKPAFRQSLIMLRPDIQWKNPVMFVVEVGTVLTIIYTIAKLLGVQSAAGVLYLLALDFWLVATLLFANFASAIAEARGKAQADALRKTRRATPARRLRADGTVEQAVSTDLRAGDQVEVVAGEVIPGDGEIVDGVASIDESAITGESAPVIREAGGDRSGVTGGTRVLSDRIVVEITANPGGSFLDRMIALVEGAIRQRTPNEVALSVVLAVFTLIFLIVTATIWPIAYNVELYMKDYVGASERILSLGTDMPTLVALLVCLIPTTIGVLLAAIGIAGMDRALRANVMAKSGKAVEVAGDVERCSWTRPERSPSATAGRRSSCLSRALRRRKSHAWRPRPGRRPNARGQEHRGLVSPLRRRQRRRAPERSHGMPMAMFRCRQDRGLWPSRRKRG